ncbi:MAG TPA: hypothetical protein PKE40_15910 [Arachnia sp.]|nr:hypothetical protein [Arachnia sp.]HMT87825.1 hypothetical protein [Arachnia sp.]
MRLFTRADRTIASELAAVLGHPVDVLAHGEGDDGVVLAGARSHLALRRDGAWQAWPWERIKGGAWRSEEQEFRWSTLTGEDFEVRLTTVHRLPELFRERVQASTVAEESFDVPGGTIQLVGRRAPGGDGEVSFYAVPRGRVSLDDEPIRRFVVEQTDRLRAELP